MVHSCSCCIAFGMPFCRRKRRRIPKDLEDEACDDHVCVDVLLDEEDILDEPEDYGW